MKKWFKKLTKNFKFKFSINSSLQDASEKSNIIKNNLKQFKNGKRNFKQKSRKKDRWNLS